MEDCCAVCAEPLEWVGYGPCGHREVCFTCIARLRFVLNDKRCCICKQDCPTVFITKALGDYTRVITDFASLPNRVLEGKQGLRKEDCDLWYDDVVQAYFDDDEAFKTIKAMCRLYCSICENASGEDAPVKRTMRKGHVFSNIDLLRRHLFNLHKVFMCELCLEGRKVFICEQKLYTRGQLDRHGLKGDSEVDGTEEERGGFAGHPICAFCRKRFYGDNELYQHMSQEHYTCHICQRARPGHYEYYRNYEDLESHFRQEHVLCEHPDCLAKKFVVFTNEGELKRHNATSHGGSMSRSQRNAALQIPVSFHFRRPGQDSSDDGNYGGHPYRRGGRGRGSHPSYSNGRSEQVEAAVRASVESASMEEALRESSAMSSGYDGPGSGNSGGISERSGNFDPEMSPSVGFSDNASEPSRYREAVYGGGPSTLGDAAFPPLPGTSKSARRRGKQKQGPASMAALLGGGGVGAGRGGIRVLNTADHRTPVSPSIPRSAPRHRVETALAHHGSSQAGRSEVLDDVGQAHIVSMLGGPGPSSVFDRPATGEGMDLISGSAVAIQEQGGFGDTVGGIDQLSMQASGLSMEDIRAANKALVDRIRTGLKGNEQQFADFKDVSSLFRKGKMSSKDYYVHIARLGLSYVVPDLARLCPDPKKAKELFDAHASGPDPKKAKELFDARAGGLTENYVDPSILPPGLSKAIAGSSQDTLKRNISPSNKFKASEQGSTSVAISSSSQDTGRTNSSPFNKVVASVQGNTSIEESITTAAITFPSLLPYTDNGVAEVLSTDGYRRAKGKAVRYTDIGEDGGPSISSTWTAPTLEGTLLNELAAVRDQPQVLSRAIPIVPESLQAPSASGSSNASVAAWSCGVCTLMNPASSTRCAVCGSGKVGHEQKNGDDTSGGSDKKKKKVPKFQRVRLGADSALLDAPSSNAWPHPSTENDKSSVRSYGRGVWNNGGGQKLVSMVQKEAIIDDAWGHGK